MEGENKYTEQVNRERDLLFENAAKRFTPEEMETLQDAYGFAEEAHSTQWRKGGEPYITHPIAVARIVSEELLLGINPVVAALLHDVVEDTPHTIDEIKERYGSDVAFLVDVLTKKKREKYETSKQVDNFQQMLNSIHYDIRALLIKLSDRLHNMRTLKSMAAEKQIKIAGETDYFYAPLANRLGLYKIKSELENLSLKYRSPHEYEDVERQLNEYAERHAKAADEWMEPIKKKLEDNHIKATVTCDKRSVYSIWSKMQEKNISFKEVEHIRIVHITFYNWQEIGITEKRQALRIYSILTDLYVEKPGSLTNYIDTPKENGYHSLHCKLMGNEGRWMEVHIQSSTMQMMSNYGCLIGHEGGVEGWISKFREVLKDIAFHGKDSGFIENVKRTFYSDDIVVFAPDGRHITMPKGATALDFAYEIHSKIGNHAKYAIINDKLSSIFTELQHGDRVKVGTATDTHPTPEWLNHAISYKALQRVRQYLRKELKNVDPEKFRYRLCKVCEPLPGDEVVGFHTDNDLIMIHKCNCEIAISEAAQQGDIIESVELSVSPRCVYPVTIIIKAVNRDGFLLDLITEISQKYKLSIERIRSITTDEIIDCTIVIYVHSINELKQVEDGIRQMKNIYEIRHITHAMKV